MIPYAVDAQGKLGLLPSSERGAHIASITGAKVRALPQNSDTVHGPSEPAVSPGGNIPAPGDTRLAVIGTAALTLIPLDRFDGRCIFNGEDHPRVSEGCMSEARFVIPDARLTMAVSGRQVKVCASRDNEMGDAQCLVDVAPMVGASRL